MKKIGKRWPVRRKENQQFVLWLPVGSHNSETSEKREFLYQVTPGMNQMS